MYKCMFATTSWLDEEYRSTQNLLIWGDLSNRLFLVSPFFGYGPVATYKQSFLVLDVLNIEIKHL